MLGVPTVSDRIAQTAVVLALGPELEKVFHPDSYGYRPGRSAHDALGITRRRCWQRDWVLEYDIRGLFDNINHELLLRAVRHHCQERWILLHVERWLKAPMQRSDGIVVKRTVGTPQGGPLSPLLANLFLHYALDHWLASHHQGVWFCRYADDGILHCLSEAEAHQMREHLATRLQECGLELHPEKTRVVYCKDSDRRRDYPAIQFDFLGYTFRPRQFKSRDGTIRMGFTPAVSRSALTAMRRTLRESGMFQYSHLDLQALADWTGPRLRGWMAYYCKYRGSEFQPLAKYVDSLIVRWAMRKHKRLRGHKTRAYAWLDRQKRQSPSLFAHWSGRGSFVVGATRAR